MSTKILISIALFFSTNLLWGQDEPKFWLPNGSFEGAPRDALNPEGWESSSYNSTPDILPGPWGVYQRPTDGNTFMGLICREDGTFESVAAKLPKALKKDKCYKFELDLSRSQAYAGYTGAACFRLWGAQNAEEPMQLLAVSEPITHYEWKTYQFNFITKAKYSYIIIECYYKTPSLLPYRGNLLLDRFLYFDYCERA